MFKTLLLPLAFLLAATTGFAKNDFPPVSHDGLHLMSDTKLRAVYMKPGADLSQYDKIALLDTFVATAGTMTLYLELHDGKTGAIIARIIDPVMRPV